MSGLINLKIISNGYAATPKSFVINTNAKYYLFNCGEGTYRISSETDVKLSRLKHIFFTRKSLECFNGFPPILLSYSNKIQNLIAHSPFQVNDILEKFKKFGNFNQISIEQHDYEKEKFNDESFEIEALNLFEIENEISNYDSDKNELKSKRFCSNTKKCDFYSYLIKVKKAQSRLKIEKLVELNVPNGPVRGQLKEGKDVVLDDGRIIRANDVLYNNTNEFFILVFDLPHIDYLEYMNKHEIFNKFNIELIVHLTNSNILHTNEYKNFIESKSTIEHLILDETHPNVHTEKILRLQDTLNILDKKIFPDFKSIFDLKPNINSIQNENIIYGQTNMLFELRPKRRMFRTIINYEKDVNILLKQLRDDSDTENFEEIIENLKSIIEQKRKSISNTQSLYPKICFLGTGSSCPSSTRNVSGILMKLDASTNILLDCGEDTLGQLIRFFNSNYEVELKNLKAIFISHHHLDHHLGIFRVINHRKELFNKSNEAYNKIYLCIPSTMQSFTHKIYKFFNKNYLNDVHLILNEYLYPQQHKYSPITQPNHSDNNQIESLINCLNLNSIQAIRVMHVKNSVGFVFETKDPTFKIVFSGDCRPSTNLITYGTNCDVLIHEATFEDSLIKDAINKKHSTVSEAIEIGKKMNAKSILLWHFSQRYAKVPLLNEDSYNSTNVSISFDNMIVDPFDLQLLPLFNNVFKIIFRKYQDEIEEKSIKYKSK